MKNFRIDIFAPVLYTVQFVGYFKLSLQ